MVCEDGLRRTRMNKGWLRWLVLLALAAGACGEGSKTCPVFATDIRLPADRAPHNYPFEWWYFTGHLWDERQQRFGFEVSFFQAAVGTGFAHISHFAVSDPNAGEHVYDQQIIIVDSPPERLDLEINGQRLWLENGSYRMQLAFSQAGVDLTATAEKPAALHNQNGIIDMGGGGWSYYYSETRLQVSGTLEVAGKKFSVQGLGWHDHQWGDFDVFASDGWDWFSLQLDDRTELMLFLLHPKTGEPQLTGCTFVDRDGCLHDLEQFELQAHRSWTSPHTGGVYPLDWTLRVPEIELQVELLATFDDQEMDSRRTTLNTYWEGEVTINGSRAGKAVTGLGYVELAGYGPWGP